MDRPDCRGRDQPGHQGPRGRCWDLSPGAAGRGDEDSGREGTPLKDKGAAHCPALGTKEPRPRQPEPPRGPPPKAGAGPASPG